MKKNPDFISIVILALLTAIYFFPVFSGRQPVPTDSLVGLYHPWRDLYSGQNPNGVPYKNYLITDPVRQLIPWRKTSLDAWKEGNIPVWNSYNFLGTPQLANIQSASLYFLNILFFLFDFSTAWTMLIFLEPFLASLFMYLYLRIIKLSVFPSLFGALAWSFCGFQIAWLTWGTITHVSLWLPLVLVSMEMIFRDHVKSRESIWWYAIFVFSLASSFFAGHSQIFLYVATASFLYLIWSFSTRKIKLWKLLSILCCYMAAAAVTAVQWYPAYELYIHSNRIFESGNWMKEGWFLPIQHLVQYLIPDYFGNPATLNYWGTWNYGEFIGYFGLAPLIFGLYFLLFGRDTRFLFFKILGLGSLFFMLPNVLNDLLYRYNVPLISSFQPTRLQVLSDFSFTVLAAAGLHHWIKDKSAKIFLIVAPFCLILGGIVLLQTHSIAASADPKIAENYLISRRNTVFPLFIFGLTAVTIFLTKYVSKVKPYFGFLPYAALFIVIADLFRFGWKFTPFSPKDYFFPETKVISFLKSQPKPFRVLSLDDRIAPPNTLAFYGIESVGGYDPIYYRRYEEFIGASERGEPNVNGPFGFNRIINPKNISSPLLASMNVKYILSFEDLKQVNLKKILEEGQTRLYEYDNATSWAFFPCQITTQPSGKNVIEALFSNNSRDYPVANYELKDGVNVSSQNCEKNYINDLHYDNSHIIFKSHASGESVIVLSVSYSPALRAYVDKSEVKIDRVNYLFSSVQVPDGDHEVAIKFSI